MELRINRDSESHRDVRSTATEGKSTVPSASGQGIRGAEPQAAVSVDVARRQVEAENLQAATHRIRDSAVAIQLAKQIRTQISARAEEAVKIQATGVTPQSLRTLFQDHAVTDPAGEAGA